MFHPLFSYLTIFPVNSGYLTSWQAWFVGSSFPIQLKQCDKKQKRLQYANILNALLKRPLGTDVP